MSETRKPAQDGAPIELPYQDLLGRSGFSRELAKVLLAPWRDASPEFDGALTLCGAHRSVESEEHNGCGKASDNRPLTVIL